MINFNAEFSYLHEEWDIQKHWELFFIVHIFYTVETKACILIMLTDFVKLTNFITWCELIQKNLDELCFALDTYLVSACGIQTEPFSLLIPSSEIANYVRVI